MATDLSNLDAFFSGKVQQLTTDHDASPVCNSISEIREEAKLKGISDVNPKTIRKVVNKVFEIQINETDLGRDVSGFLERIGDKWHIYININESEVRKRFTIAHELGHFIFHKDRYAATGTSSPDQIFFRNENNNLIERDANDFAADLLMPEEIFKTYIDEGYNTIDALADKFGLSTSAVKYRAYKLGFLSEYK
jgi:Zn-dependent peptidase ImmA (M78 family)